ncbi:Aste57867_22484 [Aphanomyces stellatus]|uniref:Aste57867_22484 protein n=1 Tax=Aphanomyces stellatus TaxID=120398 RepID=A0A485LKG5_9STRA|nr:hypothetical protein As57867_022414 [Aphanomyces stellatus]VFT99144.1 Aste57867_22484 [Aphanomyces stellatus]
MVDTLPQICRFHIYVFLEAHELYAIRGVCKTMGDTTEHPFVWRGRFETDLLVLATLPSPPSNQDEDNPEDNSAPLSRYHKTVGAVRRLCGIEASEESKWSVVAMRWTSWPLMYRACVKKLLAIRRDAARLQDEMDDMQSLRRARGQLKELTQTKGKRTGTEIRRSQLSCVKYINKSTRRAWANENNPVATLSKSELNQQLQQAEAALKNTSAAVFTLRNQLRKEYRKVLGFVDAGRRQESAADSSSSNQAHAN